jgi:hypothetical protein
VKVFVGGTVVKISKSKIRPPGFSGFLGPDDDEGTLAPAGFGGFDFTDFVKA